MMAEDSLSTRFDMGHMYLDSEDEKEQRRGIEIIGELAIDGYSPAQCLLGYLYWKGFHLPQSREKAVKWYKRAVQENNAEAKFSLGWIYLSDSKSDNDIQEGLRLMTKAAQDGNCDAQDCLGECYHYGVFLEEDASAAWHFYKKAAESGSVNSLVQLGLMCQAGEGTSHDDAAAIPYFEAAAKQGDAKGKYYLGLAYLDGQGVDVNDDKGCSLIESAAADGLELALDFLGNTYLSLGRDEESDDEKRNEYFKEAAYYLSQAAEKNDAEGQWQLGWMYIRGECFDKDEQKGREYFGKAAGQDFSPAMVALGICNEEGIGVFKNKMTAIHWYEKAAAQNNEEAIAALKRLR